MSDHAPALIVVAPLLSAFVAAAAGWLDRRLCFPAALVGMLVAVGASVHLLGRVLEGGTVTYFLGGWPPPWGIVYVVDHLNGMVLVAVSVAALVHLIAARESVESEFTEKGGQYYALQALFVTGLLGMTVTGDAFNLFVLLEIASITAYSLIAMGGDRAPLAALNYVFMGTIGASLYLLGVGYLYIMTGSLNMADIASLLPGMYGSSAIVVAFAIAMVGIWLKMAFFPLHAWLPNAYTYAPSAASSLIAPLMTKVMVYVMIRMVLSVFSPEFSFRMLALGNAVVWLSVIAIVMGSLLALMERNLKRMLSFVIVAEVGYMVGGFWLGNRAGVTGAILHVLNDVLMTLCVFLAVGNIVHKVRGCAFHEIQGLFRKMPFTMGAFVVGALSIIGVPPMCGFFSKWYLVLGALHAGHYGFLCALIFSSLVSVILFFRVIEIAFFEPFETHSGGHHPVAIQEAPLSMVVPLLVVAAGIVVAGLFSGAIVGAIVDPAIPLSIS